MAIHRFCAGAPPLETAEYRNRKTRLWTASCQIRLAFEVARDFPGNLERILGHEFPLVFCGAGNVTQLQLPLVPKGGSAVPTLPTKTPDPERS